MTNHLTARPRVSSAHVTSIAAALAAAVALGLAWTAGPGMAATPAPGCPQAGWSEGLVQYQDANAPFPTQDTARLPTPDCNFHEWSWEAFVWATALLPDSASGGLAPRFLMLPTPAEFFRADANAGKLHLRPLRLAARSHALRGAAGFTEDAGAIVQADGNMQVAPNGYPVYASVHMNESYFATARQNLIATGGYLSEPVDSSFSTGAAVFKATWLRLDPGQAAPAGAYTTQAEVPVLTTYRQPGVVTIAPVLPNKFVTVTVALVGLHVVGSTVNHPEFLWGTFEHNQNSPQTPDNTFSPSGTDPKNYTFYTANTPFSQANVPVNPPTLTLDETTQKLSPITNLVLENRTGGENQPGGVGNIEILTSQSQGFLAGEKAPQSTFASYSLIGTVWMLPNTYSLTSNQTDAVGSVDLANGTAETFVQNAQNTPISGVLNCFLCHNAGSYSFQTPPPAKLPNRLIALSHTLAHGTAYATPNAISGKAVALPFPRGK